MQSDPNDDSSGRASAHDSAVALYSQVRDRYLKCNAYFDHGTVALSTVKRASGELLLRRNRTFTTHFARFGMFRHEVLDVDADQSRRCAWSVELVGGEVVSYPDTYQSARPSSVSPETQSKSDLADPWQAVSARIGQRSGEAAFAIQLCVLLGLADARHPGVHFSPDVCINDKSLPIGSVCIKGMAGRHAAHVVVDVRTLAISQWMISTVTAEEERVSAVNDLSDLVGRAIPGSVEHRALTSVLNRLATERYDIVVRQVTNLWCYFA